MPDPARDSDAHDIPGIGHGVETRCVEWCPICRSADVLRASTTPEVREQWHDMQREALLTVRALIDRYIQHLEAESADRARSAEQPSVRDEPYAQPRPATPVEEIPTVE